MILRNADTRIRTARRRHLSGWVLGFVCLTLCAAPSAQAADDAVPVKQYVRELESSYKGVRSLRAEFSQSYRWGSRTRTETGTVYFARGGRMRIIETFLRGQQPKHHPSPKIRIDTS